MRNYVQRLSAHRGIYCGSRDDGARALAAARRLKPDLVLSDIMMPKLDGFGLLTALRNDPNCAIRRCCCCRRGRAKRPRSRALSAGADDYLIKPFSARELLGPRARQSRHGAMRRESLRAESELRLQAQMAQERVEGILASINDGFLALDEDWRFIYVNASAERLLGRSAAGAARQGLLGGISGTSVPMVGAQFSQGDGRAGQRRLRGLPRALQTGGSTCASIPSRDRGLSIYFQDITETKERRGRASARLNETLERLVAERTAELRFKEARLRDHF